MWWRSGWGTERHQSTAPCTCGTIEERILALQERKAALAASIYSGAAARKRPLFSDSDLAELLRPLSAG